MLSNTGPRDMSKPIYFEAFLVSLAQVEELYVVTRISQNLRGCVPYIAAPHIESYHRNLSTGAEQEL